MILTLFLFFFVRKIFIFFLGIFSAFLFLFFKKTKKGFFFWYFFVVEICIDAANKIFKPFLPREALLDIAFLWISTFFIGIDSLCCWYVCFYISKSPNFIIFSIFIYAFKNLHISKIYNFPHFFIMQEMKTLKNVLRSYILRNNLQS